MGSVASSRGKTPWVVESMVGVRGWEDIGGEGRPGVRLRKRVGVCIFVEGLICRAPPGSGCTWRPASPVSARPLD